MGHLHSLSGKYLLVVSACFLVGLFEDLFPVELRILYIFSVLILSQTCGLGIFSLSLYLSFLLLHMGFRRAKGFDFEKIRCIIFKNFMDHAVDVKSKNYSPSPGRQRFYCFVFRSYVVLVFYIKFIIYFELIFAFGVRLKSRFLLFPPLWRPLSAAPRVGSPSSAESLCARARHQPGTWERVSRLFPDRVGSLCPKGAQG